MSYFTNLTPPAKSNCFSRDADGKREPTQVWDSYKWIESSWCCVRFVWGFLIYSELLSCGGLKSLLCIYGFCCARDQCLPVAGFVTENSDSDLFSWVLSFLAFCFWPPLGFESQGAASPMSQEAHLLLLRCTGRDCHTSPFFGGKMYQWFFLKVWIYEIYECISCNKDHSLSVVCCHVLPDLHCLSLSSAHE